MQLFHVETMTCQGCAAAITRALHAVDSAAVIQTFPSIRLVKVQSGLDQHKLIEAFAKAGYPAGPYTGDQRGES
nr:heavy-metal-associated domain-containing protein [Cellvibrio fontiphilus]